MSSWFKKLFSKSEPQEIEMKGSPKQEQQQLELEQAAEKAHDRKKMEERLASLNKELGVETDPIEKVKKEIELTKLSCELNELNPFLKSICDQELMRLETLLKKLYEEQQLGDWDRSSEKSVVGNTFFSDFGGGKKKMNKSKRTKSKKSKRTKSNKSKRTKSKKSKRTKSKKSK
jgi:hypothetical protein